MIYDIYVHVNSKLSIMSGISRNATYLTKTNKQTNQNKKKQKNKNKKKYRQTNKTRTGCNIKYVWTRLNITHFNRKKLN